MLSAALSTGHGRAKNSEKLGEEPYCIYVPSDDLRGFVLGQEPSLEGPRELGHRRGQNWGLNDRRTRLEAGTDLCPVMGYRSARGRSAQERLHEEVGAGDGDRTRDLLLGKETLYR